MTERISRRKFLVWAGVGTGTVVAGAFGVNKLLNSGNGKGEAEVIKNPTAVPTEKPTPTPVPTAEPTPTPKPTPEPTPTPEEWNDEVIAAKLFSVVDLANQVADAYPESELLNTVKADTQTAFEEFKQVLKTKDYQSVLVPLNGIGNVGSRIGQFVCFTTEGKGEPEGQAWFAIKDLVLNAGLKYENAGFLEEGMTATFKQAFFTVPEVCPNPNAAAILK